MLDAKPLIFKSSTSFPSIRRKQLRNLQVNLGYRCNLSCSHCHVNAGPTRTEAISAQTAARVIEVLDRYSIESLDLTGGAPELSDQFRPLVEAATSRGVKVIDRCNLTVLNEPGYSDLAAYLASQRVHVVASLPCYSQQNVDAQRGKGVFERSIEGLLALNRLGYGRDGSGLTLDLVYNPGGPFLPPDQSGLETQYKQHLADEYGVFFNKLLTIANMPINRFGAQLMAKGHFDSYMQLLYDNHREDNLHGVMCRETISVDWRGYLYDCDFNQMLNLPLTASASEQHLEDLLSSDFHNHPIATASHCFGCTAGQGSSCGGALAEK